MSFNFSFDSKSPVLYFFTKYVDSKDVYNSLDKSS